MNEKSETLVKTQIPVHSPFSENGILFFAAHTKTNFRSSANKPPTKKKQSYYLNIKLTFRYCSRASVSRSRLSFSTVFRSSSWNRSC